jgi:hypothetical protein
MDAENSESKTVPVGPDSHAASTTAASAADTSNAPQAKPGAETDRFAEIVHTLDEAGFNAGSTAKKSKRVTKYRITSCLDGRICTTEKRFSEFLHLYEQLEKANPKAILPEPPGKKLGGEGDEFLEERRAALELFFCDIAASNLRSSAELSSWLELPSIPPPHSLCSRLHITIPQYTTEERAVATEDGKTEAVVTYRINILDKLTGKTWQANKRYSEFAALNDHLKKVTSSVPLPAFPSKSVLSLAIGQSKVVEERRVKFEAYLTEVLKSRGHCKAILSFLGLTSDSPSTTSASTLAAST